MKAVLQRVTSARVEVAGRAIATIGDGLLALVAAVKGDTPAEAAALARKILEYRVFEDDAGKMNRSVGEIGGAILVVSQFTLAADGRKGRRPSFDAAAEPPLARRLLEGLVERLRASGLRVAAGEFGAAMDVVLVNRGPATFLLDEPPPAGVDSQPRAREGSPRAES